MRRGISILHGAAVAALVIARDVPAAAHLP